MASLMTATTLNSNIISNNINSTANCVTNGNNKQVLARTTTKAASTNEMDMVEQASTTINNVPSKLILRDDLYNNSNNVNPNIITNSSPLSSNVNGPNRMRFNVNNEKTSANDAAAYHLDLKISSLKSPNGESVEHTRSALLW